MKQATNAPTKQPNHTKNQASKHTNTNNQASKQTNLG